MKVLTDKEHKALVAECLLYNDMCFDTAGKRNKRNTFTAAQFQVFKGIVEKFSKTMEVGSVKKSVLANGAPVDTDFVYTKPGEAVKCDDPKEYVPLTERHTDIPIELDDLELGLIKECVYSRSELEKFDGYNELKVWLE